MATRLYATLTLSAVSLTVLALIPKLYWVIGYPAVAAVAGSALAYGAISSLVAARRLYFLAHVAPHMALLAAPISALLLGFKWDWILAIAIVTALMLLSGYSLHRGADADVVASIMVSLTASLTVIALYYAQRSVGAGRVSQLILGDPLLVGSPEGYAALALGLAIATISLAVAREVFYIGVSREVALVSGLNVWAYDALLYTLIAVTIASMLKITGFLVATVLTLLPGAIAAIVAKGSLESVVASIALALTASALGLASSIALSLPPSGVTGLILVLAYIAARGVARVG